MADTESDPAGASPQLRLPRRSVRLTLRLRLTLLYGAVFIAAGTGLLAVTYGLFKHNQNASSRTVSLRGVQFTLPAGAEFQAVVAGRGPVKLTSKPPKTVHVRRGSGGVVWEQAGKPTTATVLRQIRKSGQAQLLNLAQRANFGLKREQASDASSLLEWSAVALGAVVLLSTALAWWLAGRALRPLRRMNSRAREISAENLQERLGADGRNDELGELATTFDALLARLESAFESQRRFVANASHEMRTPITLERTLVEVALADPDASVDSLRRVCERVVAATEEQERLLDALLTLARSEAGVEAGETVNLAAVVEDALLAREPQLAGLRVETALEPAVVVGDRALLERLVGNLLANAIVHNDSRERWIGISTGAGAGGPVLHVANSGPVIPSDEVEALFEPFRRGQGERLGTGAGGLGLGLSIVRAVVTAHAGTIEAHALPDGGLEFDLRFASATGAGPQADQPEAAPVPLDLTALR